MIELTVEDEAFLKYVKKTFPRYVKVGKCTGQVRLHGPAWDCLREYDWNRDGNRCINCCHPLLIQKGYWNSVQCAHRKSKGSGGSDLPSNTRSLCLNCHAAEHRGKPIQ